MLNAEEIKIALVHVFRNSPMNERKVESILNSYDHHMFSTKTNREIIYNQIYGVIRTKSYGVSYEVIGTKESLIDYFLRISDAIRFEQPELSTERNYTKVWEIFRTRNYNLFCDEDFEIIQDAYRHAEVNSDMTNLVIIEKILTNAEDKRIDARHAVNQITVQNVQTHTSYGNRNYNNSKPKTPYQGGRYNKKSNC